jgi:hypothetical protein
LLAEEPVNAFPIKEGAISDPTLFFPNKMPSPDATDLIRLLSGESVFDRDTDSKILQAANEVSGRALFELFKRCDTSSPEWAREFAHGLMEIATGDPSVLIGFDDGRWQGLDSGGEEALEDSPDTSVEYFLRLQFTGPEACYYQVDLFPTFLEPFIQEVTRKRTDDSQFLRIKLSHPDDLQVFIQNLRGNPHFVKVHDLTREEFDLAIGHAM